MRPLYSQEEFDSARGVDVLPLECYTCGGEFAAPKTDILRGMREPRRVKKYCSRKCAVTKISVTCVNCGEYFYRVPNQLKKYKNSFCSKSCSATHGNKHKTHGTNRSKLEMWLGEQLGVLYPDLSIDFNKSDTIKHELDIYIPSLNLAFELNGIFHYEPIFGKDKLDKTRKTDSSKSKACIDNEIDLCVIDTTGQKYFKPKTSQKYLNILVEVINGRIADPVGFEPT